MSERELLLKAPGAQADPSTLAAISPLRAALRGRVSRGSTLHASLERLMALRAEIETRAASVRQALEVAQLVPPFWQGVALSELEKQRDQLLRCAACRCISSGLNHSTL